MEDAFEEMKVVQAVGTRVKTLIGAAATPTTMLERLHDHPFVHVVCRGILEPGKPFDSSFKLYNDKRLSLLDIVRSRLPNAEFAFLAACHTAELTDESPADEALHLTAAILWVPQRRWHNVGHGRYRWAALGRELLQVYFLRLDARGTFKLL
jgi:CHAT domain-containing protein